MGTGSPGPETNSSTNSGMGRRIEEAVARIEKEMRDAITYLNGNVVPEVRRESIVAMRTIAGTLAG